MIRYLAGGDEYAVEVIYHSTEWADLVALGYVTMTVTGRKAVMIRQRWSVRARG